MIQSNGLDFNSSRKGLAVGDVPLVNLNYASKHMGFGDVPIGSIRLSEFRVGKKRLSDTAPVESLLRYLAGCALPAGTTVETNDGLALSGGVGLASNWVHAGLTDTEKRRVSACTAALANAYGAHVEVDLRHTPSYSQIWAKDLTISKASTAETCLPKSRR